MSARVVSSVIVLTVALMAVTGCGSTRSVGARPSGFLGDLSELQPIDARVDGEVFVLESGILGKYDRFTLEPVVIVFAEGASARAIDPEDLARLTASLREKVATALRDGGYEVVDSAGPGVLRVRAALTDVDASRPGVNLAGKAAGNISGVGGFVVPAVDLGGAAIEAEMIDAATGQRVAAYRDARRGKRFGGTLNAARKWGHAEAAFGVWATELRDRLDALRAGR